MADALTGWRNIDTIKGTVRTDAALVDAIEAARAENNGEWMALLRLALEAEPAKAKAILSRIADHDSQIQTMLKELSR